MSVSSILRLNKVGINTEVIISDYGSAESWKVSALAVELGVRHVYSPAFYWSRAACLNAGVARAAAPVILAGDVDMYWPEESVKGAFERFQRLGNAVMAFQTRDLGPESTERMVAGDWPSTRELVSLSVPHSRWGSGILMYRKDDWAQIGGYDERMKIYGSEDIDFRSRLQRAGRRFYWTDYRYSPIFHVWHLKFTSDDSEWKKRLINANRGYLCGSDNIYRNLESRFRAETPLVSVVIATADRPDMLRDAISTVLYQTMQDFEIIVIDDGQIVSAEAMCLSFSDDRIRYFTSAGIGISAARNQGTDEARGEFIAVLDDDDLMPRTRLADSLDAITGGVQGVVGHFVNFDNETGQTTIWGDYDPNPQDAVANAGFAGHSTWLMRREVFEAIRYDETYSSAVDNNIAMRILKAGVRLKHTGTVLNVRRMHSGQVTNLDGHSQKYGAVLTKSWVQTGYSDEDIRSAEIQARKAQSKTRADQQQVNRIHFSLPDHLCKRTVVFSMPAELASQLSDRPSLIRTEVHVDSDKCFDRYFYRLEDAKLAEIGELVGRGASIEYKHVELVIAGADTADQQGADTDALGIAMAALCDKLIEIAELAQTEVTELVKGDSGQNPDEHAYIANAVDGNALGTIRVRISGGEERILLPARIRFFERG